MSTHPTHHWIDRGQSLPRLGPDSFKDDLNLPFRHFSLVQVRTQANVTHVRWDPRHPCRSSICAAVEAVLKAGTAAMLHYYKSGWFSEPCATAEKAAIRIFEIQDAKHVDILKPAFVRQTAYDFKNIPPLIRLMMSNPYIYGEYAVETVYDGEDDWFPATFSGRHSASARILGSDWIEQGLLGESALNRDADDEITREFAGVLNTWKARYDQIMASLAREDGEPRWVPYHRVVVPRKTKDGYGTANLIALGPVDLSPFGENGPVAVPPV